MKFAKEKGLDAKIKGNILYIDSIPYTYEQLTEKPDIISQIITEHVNDERDVELSKENYTSEDDGNGEIECNAKSQLSTGIISNT